MASCPVHELTKQVDDCENDANNSMRDLRGRQISTRCNTCRSFCTGVLNGSPHHRYRQNTKWGNPFWMNGVHPSSWFPETETLWPSTLLSLLIISWICPLLCISHVFYRSAHVTFPFCFTPHTNASRAFTHHIPFTVFFVRWEEITIQIQDNGHIAKQLSWYGLSQTCISGLA